MHSGGGAPLPSRNGRTRCPKMGSARAGTRRPVIAPSLRRTTVPPMPTASLDPERLRLRDAHEGAAAWRRWGPYLADRAWGTVREDYSATGDAWHYLPHDHARSRAYRWGEDGLLGISDEGGRLCFAVALWNE